MALIEHSNSYLPADFAYFCRSDRVTQGAQNSPEDEPSVTAGSEICHRPDAFPVTKPALKDQTTQLRATILVEGRRTSGCPKTVSETRLKRFRESRIRRLRPTCPSARTGKGW